AEAVEQAGRRDVAVDDPLGVRLLEALQRLEHEAVVDGALARRDQRRARGVGGHEVAARAVGALARLGDEDLEGVVGDADAGGHGGRAREVVDQHVEPRDRVDAAVRDDPVDDRVLFAALETSGVGHAASIAPRVPGTSAAGPWTRGSAGTLGPYGTHSRRRLGGAP